MHSEVLRLCPYVPVYCSHWVTEAVLSILWYMQHATYTATVNVHVQQRSVSSASVLLTPWCPACNIFFSLAHALSQTHLHVNVSSCIILPCIHVPYECCPHCRSQVLQDKCTSLISSSTLCEIIWSSLDAFSLYVWGLYWLPPKKIPWNPWHSESGMMDVITALFIRPFQSVLCTIHANGKWLHHAALPLSLINRDQLSP